MVEEEADFRHYRALGDVTRVERTPRGLLLEIGAERFRAEALRPDLLRLALSRGRAFDDQPTFAGAACPTAR